MQQQGSVDGSSYIMRLLTNTITRQGKNYSLPDFDGRGDYWPFLAAGIPAAALCSGAEDIKSMEESKEYGGLAQAPYDPCYHKECDDTLNVNLEELALMSCTLALTLELLVTDCDLRQHLNYPLRHIYKYIY